MACQDTPQVRPCRLGCRHPWRQTVLTRHALPSILAFRATERLRSRQSLHAALCSPAAPAGVRVVSRADPGLAELSEAWMPKPSPQGWVHGVFRKAWVRPRCDLPQHARPALQNTESSSPSNYLPPCCDYSRKHIILGILFIADLAGTLILPGRCHCLSLSPRGHAV